jgi:hypothetical protein
MDGAPRAGGSHKHADEQTGFDLKMRGETGQMDERKDAVDG